MPERPKLLYHMGLVSFRLFCKNLGNLQEFFGQTVYRPPWPKIARTPMGTHCRRNPSAPGLFCRDYQREQCLSIKDHFGFIHGERKWLKHICVACWTRLRQQESHRKISSDCPLKALAAKDSPATPKN